MATRPLNPPASAAGLPIPQALLVYHESAHSIVFRDQMRRQQTAIRRTSALPEASSDGGYESGGSRGSTRSGRSAGESLGSAGGGGRTRGPGGAGGAPRGPPAPPTVVVANFRPAIEPLARLELEASHVFAPLLDADPFRGDGALALSGAEREVVELLREERAVVKTIRNSDWTAFLQKFKPSDENGGGAHEHHPAQRAPTATEPDTPPDAEEHPFNSFVTSTTILPSCGKKMRCFGSTNEYAISVVFALPSAFPDDASESAAATRSKTWSWPSGYSAKTEFNIDNRGNLINGREEALVPLSGMRAMNHAYLYETDYIVGGRMVKGGLGVIPYNEVYIRVGGRGRISGGVDVATRARCDDAAGSGRSFDRGLGLPVALFVREADYGHLVRLLRTRARYAALFGAGVAAGLPLLLIEPERGVRVFTEALQHQVLKKMTNELNPFQNPTLSHQTGVRKLEDIDNVEGTHFNQKLEELLDLDDECMKQVLTPEEKARIAGGFGATDESVANLLSEAMSRDMLAETGGDGGPNLQDLVNEGLAFSLRANDYHTSRQLLILYTLVAAKGHNKRDAPPRIEADEGDAPDTQRGDLDEQTQEETAEGPCTPLDAGPAPRRSTSAPSGWRDAEKHIDRRGGKELQISREERVLGAHYVPPPPPPPPLDTDRLRSATNSDGLLAVLGAAQVLRAMRDGSAKRRVKESVHSVEEWVENGEQSVAFRVASWREQRAAQGDLKIAMENDSNFMAFISNKAISNRRKFAKQLRDATAATDFDSLQFLKAIYLICSAMNSPCLRLELLQYILGLDNRYSVAHVTRSVELAATCLNLSENDALDGDLKELSE